jgi:2,5-diketo-D-gluconate reductase A
MEYRKMNDGLEIPQMGYGVFMMTSAEVAEHLPQAIEVGYRHIDTANAYYNEVAVGEAMRSSGVAREDFFLTTKLFPQDYGADVCMRAIDASLRRLGTDYVDLLLLHQPYGAYTEAWKVLEEAQRAGKVRSIGLSNFNQTKFQQVLDVADVVPQVLQVEINPRNNQHEMKAWLADKDVVFEGWYPLGHGDKALLQMPVFVELAEKYGKTPAQVILRWHIQSGNVIFPKTSNPDHMRDNLSVFDFELTADEMARIDAIPQQPYYVVPDEPPAFVLEHADFDQQH